MIYLLFFLVLILAILDFIFQNKDILSPSLWAIIVFLFSIFINVLNANRWGISYSWRAMFFILLALCMIIFGELFAKKIKGFKISSNNNGSALRTISNLPIVIENSAICLFIILSLLCLVVDIRIMMRITGTSDVFSALYDARHVLSSGEEKRGFIGRLVLSINKSLAFIFIYIILHNKILCDYKNKIGYFFPILFFCIDAVLSTGRTLFIRIIAYVFIMYVLFSSLKKRFDRKQLRRIILIAIYSMCAFFLVFTYLGKLIGKGKYDSASDVFFYYSGSPVYLFNNYIINGGKPNSSYFGEHTLYGIYNILHYIIPNIEHNSNPALEMSYIPHWYSNIYTAFRRYYQDYGIGGLIVMPFTLGTFYGALEADAYSISGWKAILFAYSIYPIIEISIEERFLVNYLSFSTIFELFIMYTLYKLINMFCISSKKIVDGNNI